MRAAAVWLLVLLGAGCTESLPSEEQLRARWKQRQAELEQLVRMSNEDFERARVTRVSPRFVWRSDNWLWPRPEEEWGISRGRWEQYKTLCARLALPACVDRAGPEHGAILLAVHGAGVAGGGDEYGYLWAARRPMPVDAKGQTFMVKPLEGNWYLYRWKVDKKELDKSTSTRFSSDSASK